MNPAPWTAEEQKLLEQSMKTYGANTPERWERIAESIPNRSKKDCMKRYKVSLCVQMLEHFAESTPNRSKKDCMKHYKVSLCVQMLEHFAESTPNRSEKDCMKRYKVSLYVGDACMHH